MDVPCPRCGMPTRLAPGLDGPERWCWTHGTLTETRAPTADDEANRGRLAKQDSALAAMVERRPRPTEPPQRTTEPRPRRATDALRRCRRCGLEARTAEDLEGFARQQEARHGRRNLCRPCASAVTHSGRGTRSATDA